MKVKTIKQTVTFAAAPGEIYSILMDSKKHSALTGDRARIGKKVGDSFTAFGDYASGKNLQLIPGKKIMQEWHASDWPQGHMSKVTFSLTKSKLGTKLSFVHENVPAEFAESISEGWEDYYFEPLKNYLERQRYGQAKR